MQNLRRRSLVIATLLWAPLAAPQRAAAYDQAGHFYTAFAMVSTILPVSAKPRDRLLVALCAQLPDMAADLDATAVYRTAVLSAAGSPLQWLAWVRHSEVRNDDIARMVVIQQQLHSLTGGPAVLATAAGDALLTHLRTNLNWTDPKQLCALGFALHYLGDTRAHRVLHTTAEYAALSASNLGEMYATGLGHAKDLHYPDYPLCDTKDTPPHLIHTCTTVPGNPAQEHGKFRFDVWRELIRGSSTSYDAGPPELIDSPQRERLIQAVQVLGPYANDANNWNDTPARLRLSGLALNDWDGVQADAVAKRYQEFIDGEKSSRSCEEVLQDALVKLPGLTELNKFQCKDVWAIYGSAIQTVYAAAGQTREPLGTPYTDAIFTKSPLLPPRAAP